MMLHSTLVYWINLERQVTVAGTSLKDCDTNTDILPFGITFYIVIVHISIAWSVIFFRYCFSLLKVGWMQLCRKAEEGTRKKDVAVPSISYCF